jgi:hypothetical protein
VLGLLRWLLDRLLDGLGSLDDRGGLHRLLDLHGLLDRHWHRLGWLRLRLRHGLGDELLRLRRWRGLAVLVGEQALGLGLEDAKRAAEATRRVRKPSGTEEQDRDQQDDPDALAIEQATHGFCLSRGTVLR